jgi:hypothetical protein
VDKDELLVLRRPLLDVKFSRGLSPEESRTLDDIERQLNEIETAEADEFDRNYPKSRAGKIEVALDRLEASLQAAQKIKRAGA